jgi:hypothetical protein
MDQTRFDNANKLWNAGRNEDAAHEFHAIAEETNYSDEKAAILANEHKCYLQIGQLDKANEIMRQMRALPVHDSFVRMIIDIGETAARPQPARQPCQPGSHDGWSNPRPKALITRIGAYSVEIVQNRFICNKLQQVAQESLAIDY